MVGRRAIFNFVKYFYLVVTAVFLIFPPHTLALADYQVKIQADGTVLVNHQYVPGALRVDGKQETILLSLVKPTDEGRANVLIDLALPVTMPHDWQPKLIPSRCSCPSTVNRVSATEFGLTLTGLSTGSSLALEAIFPVGTFALSATQKAALGVQTVSPWLFGLASLLLAASLGFLIWLIRELAAMRKFRYTAKPIDHPPNGLSPAIVSLIPSGKITAGTMSAMLIDLANRGYIKIDLGNKTFTLTELRPLDLTGPGFAYGSVPTEITPLEEVAKAQREGLSMAEKFFLSKLFIQDKPSVSERELKARLGHRLSSWKIGKVYAEIYKQVTTDGYFIRNPHTIHLKYRAAGIMIFFFGLAAFGGVSLLAGNKLFLQLAFSLVALVGYTITRMVSYLPLLTVTGQAEWVHWAGFQAYLTDKTPLDPKLPTHQFYDYLGYALAYNALDAWAARFGDRQIMPVDWLQTEPKLKPVKEVVDEIDHLTKYLTSVLAAIHEHTVV